MENPLRSALRWSPSLKHSQAGAQGLAHHGTRLAFPLLPLAPIWIRTRVALFFFFFFFVTIYYRCCCGCFESMFSFSVHATLVRKARSGKFKEFAQVTC